jgi:hypothetical protein
MRLLSRSIVLFALTCVLLCLSVAGQADNKETAKPSKSIVTTRAAGDSAANALQFPEVEGWESSAKRPIPAPGDGYTVAYDSPGYAAVTVYVYSHGHEKITDDLGGVIKDELEGAADAIRTVARMGIYSEVKEGKTETVLLGGNQGKVKVLTTNFTLIRGDQKMNSEIYLLPYRNNIVKLRVTRSASATADMNSSFAKLMLALDGLFAQ